MRRTFPPLDQLADPGTRGTQKADHKIPEHIIIPFQAAFQTLIIPFGYNIVKKGLLLMPDRGKFIRFQKINGGSRGIWSGVTHVAAGLEGRHILVDSIYTRVHCAGFVAFHKPCFVRLEILHGNITVQTVKMPDRGEIGVDGICRGAPPLQEIMEIL